MARRSVALWFAIVAVVLAACGGSPSGQSETAADPTAADEATAGGDEGAATESEPAVEEAEPVTLTFWNYWDGNNGEVMQQLVDDWNADNPDVQVENVFVGFDDLLPKLQAAAAGGDAPELAAGDLIWLPKLIESGRLVALDDHVPADKLSGFFPEMSAVGEHEGATYSVPVSSNNLQLFYNRELFEAAGLDPETPPTTWAELREMANECADPAAGRQGLELFTEPGEGLTWQFQVYLWQAGGDFLTEDGTAAAFNSPEGERALQYWVDLLAEEASIVAPWGAFGQGNACMMMDGSWMVGIWADDPPFDFGTATMPYPSDGEPATNMGGEQLFVLAEEPARVKAAAGFIDWLTSIDAQRRWDVETGFMPVQPTLVDDPEFRSTVEADDPRLLPFVEGAQHARSRPSVPTYPEASDAFSRELERALLGDISVSEALANAEQAVNDQLGGS